MKRKNIVFIAYNLGVVVLFFVLIELILRLGVANLNTQSCDSKIGIENKFGNSAGLIPNACANFFSHQLCTNEFGFRKTLHFNPKKKTKVYLGDSVTMGVGVDDDSTFTKLLANQCDENILNASLIGYGINDYKNVSDYFLTNKEKYNLDEITIFWCLNDVYSGNLNKANSPAPLTRITSFFKNHSYLYIYLKGLLFDRSNNYYQFDKQFYTENDSSFNQALVQMSEIYQNCMDDSVQLNVVILPYEYQYRTHENAFEPQNLLALKLRDFGMEVIAAQNAFANQGDSKKMYLYADGIHFSNKGNRLMAAFLSNKNI